MELEPDRESRSAPARWLLVTMRLNRLPEKMEGGSQKVLTFWSRFTLVATGAGVVESSSAGFIAAVLACACTYIEGMLNNMQMQKIQQKVHNTLFIKPVLDFLKITPITWCGTGTVTGTGTDSGSGTGSGVGSGAILRYNCYCH